ncbi:hypothetical protein SCT_1018 [Sulfuricella sp. T08]|uniref:hypothetical protein n=1 Tax=Sulfuricella sp. T08 TaxID=1632857 RepID=UPI000617A02D|nr:hypothetical protein [Sulfuricella sp. T08]GAO35627.1 hypothetical protein SCT_1018 [Sulfuricella sp. T08]
MNDEFIKVPYYIEPDGSKTLFLPSVRLTKGYRIGEKGSERYISDYWEALTELRKLSAPRFRRRNKNNIPGIVTCKFGDIDEVKRSCIEDELTNT